MSIWKYKKNKPSAKQSWKSKCYFGFVFEKGSPTTQRENGLFHSTKEKHFENQKLPESNIPW